MRTCLIALCLHSALAASAAAQYLECKGTKDNNDLTADLEIKTPWIGSPTIFVRIWGITLKFEVETVTATHYYAIEKPRDLRRLSLHRMSGLLSWQFLTPKEYLPILIDLCENRITGEECVKRAPGVETSNACTVRNLKEQCDWWRVGMTLVSTWDFTCVPTTQKF